jgi:hypothetical protein
MNEIKWAQLTIAADQLDDLEAVRKATQNRLRALCQPVEVDGVVIDKGGPDTMHAQAVEIQLGAIQEAETAAVKELKRAMKEHPLADFVKSVKGIGDKTVARLLGVIGDPAIKFDPETGEITHRSLSQLRSYCGYGDAEQQKRRKGVQSNWNTRARTALHVIADAAIKTRCDNCRSVEQPEDEEGWIAPPADCTCLEGGRKYRAVYDEARGKDDLLNLGDSDGHRHMRALRKVKKAFLKDLWLEARAVHNIEDEESEAVAA